jgi:hypothetical protein
MPAHSCATSRPAARRELNDDDALNLWRAFAVSGTPAALLQIFRSFDKHPLLIQALAGEIKRDHRANDAFEAWRQAHAQFDPMSLTSIRRRESARRCPKKRATLAEERVLENPRRPGGPPHQIR